MSEHNHTDELTRTSKYVCTANRMGDMN